LLHASTRRTITQGLISNIYVMYTLREEHHTTLGQGVAEGDKKVLVELFPLPSKLGQRREPSIRKQ